MNENQKLLKKFKPKKFGLLLYSLIALSPLGHLLIDLHEGDTKRIALTITLSIIGLLYLIFLLYDYKKGKELYKELQDHFQNK